MPKTKIKRNVGGLIFDLLQSSHLLTAGDVQEQLKQSGHEYNKTSIYRALERLEAEGKVCKHHFADKEAMFEARADHVHLVCEQCGDIRSARCSYHQPDSVGDFKVDHHHLTLLGLCKNCRQSQKK